MIIDQTIRQEVLDTAQSFLVQAPAGSGKTSLLVQRFLSLLAEVEQAPEEILALTFTRKAAAEMRDRIIDALQLGLQNSAPDNEYEFKLWSLAQKVLLRDKHATWELIDNPARLKIQTIDALCANITAQMPIMAQFGAQPQITTKPEILYQKAVNQLLQESSLATAWGAELNILLAHLDNDRLKVNNLLISMLKIREQWLPVVVQHLSQQEIRSVLEASLETVIDEALSNLHSVVPEIVDFELLQCQEPETLDDCLQLANILLTQTGVWRSRLTAAEGFPAPSAASKEERAHLKVRKDAAMLMLEKLHNHEIFRQHLAAIRQLPATRYSDKQWEVLNSLAIVLRVLVANLTLVFKDSGQVDFCQVTLSAIQALSDQDPPSELSLALDCKIRHILIDEFQDTSLVQFDLLQKLTANWHPHDGKTMFLVGDPMQSIYRFRKAEVSLFLQVKEYGFNNITLKFAQLKVNFRSTPQIVEWINNAFKYSFPLQDDMVYGAISYMPAVAATLAEIDKTVPAVECFAESQSTEVSRIVKIIKQIKTDTPTKSIAILVRAKSHLKYILPALRAENIAYQGVELETLKDRPLIQDLLALTRAILHLDDRIAWFAILRAPWCGLLLKDLQVLADFPQTIWQALQQEEILECLSTDARLRCQPLISIMTFVISNRARFSIARLVEMAWEALGGKLCSSDRRLQMEAEEYFNLLAELAMLREIFSIQFLEQQLQALYLPILTIDKSAVQIMSMHKAKGLEFDVVILPSLGKRTRRDSDKLLLMERRNYPQDCLLLAPIKSAYEKNDSIYRYLAWAEKQRQNHEELRLLYVATTRAIEKIYCLCIHDYAGLPAIKADLIFSEQNEPNVIKTESKSISRLPSAWYENNAFQTKTINTCDLSPQVLHQDYLRVIGLVVHRIFCNLVKEGLESWTQSHIFAQKHLWTQHLRQLGLAETNLEAALNLIEQAIYKTINDPMGQKILSAQYPESYAEWSLTVHQAPEFKQVILDRAFLDADGVFWIVDYKILHADADMAIAIERYSNQVLKYTCIISKLRPELKIRAGLYFPLQAQWCEL